MEWKGTGAEAAAQSLRAGGGGGGGDAVVARVKTYPGGGGLQGHPQNTKRALFFSKLLLGSFGSVT
jgi:hypothetical protein